MRVQIIFLGNILYSDDKIGIIIGSKLKDKLQNLGCNVEILESIGYTLIDYLEGYDIAIIVDSIKTNKHPVGSVLLFEDEDFKSAPTSPHYAGLPEALEIMRELGIKIPKTYIIAIEVKDPYTVSNDISSELKTKLNYVVSRVFELIVDILNTVRP